jgi:cell division ATPase FtsA
MLDGMIELAEETLGLPVRQGLPLGVRGLTEELAHPVYATSIGLALFGADEAGFRKQSAGKTNSTPGFFNRILSWAGR